MKKYVFTVVLFVNSMAYSQVVANERCGSTRVFCFTPRFLKIEKVNGLTFGLGLNYIEQTSIREVNGWNIEANPMSLLLLMFADPTISGFPEKATVVLNGLDISSGRYNGSGDIAINGLSITSFNSGYATNGICISGIYNYQTKSNGIAISGLSNSTEYSKGIIIAPFNSAENMYGLQIGLSNTSVKMYGLQIGLYNKALKVRGLQVGLWNSNNKRSFPFFNW